MHDATRLAAQGLFACWECGNVGPQEAGIVVAFAGNVLMAMHPECMRGEIVIRRDGGKIYVEVPKLSQRHSILSSDLATSDVSVAKPNVEKTKLTD